MSGSGKSLTREELLAYEKLPVPFCVFHVSRGISRLLAASAGLCRLLHASRESLGAPFSDLMSRYLHPQDFAKLRRNFESACLNPEGLYEAVYRIRISGEDYRWISANGSLVRQPDGSYLLYAYLSDVQDETELRREAAADRLRHDTLLANILSTTHTAIFWKDADRRFLGANKSFLDYYGFKDESAILGKNDEEMGWHTDPDPYKNDELRILRDGASTCRVRGKCLAKGENRDIVASKSPLVIGGRIVGLVGSFEDVTTEARQQEDIERLKNELEKRIEDHDLLMNTSEVCIIRIDLSDYSIIEYNDAMCRMIGYSREEYERLFHRDMKAYFVGEYRKELESLGSSAAAAIAEGRQTFTLNMRIPTKGGSAWIGGAASLAAAGGASQPQHLYAVYRDITDIIEAQKKLELAEIELQKKAALEVQRTNLRRMVDSVPSGLSALRIVNGAPDKTMQLNRYFSERVDLPVGENKDVELQAFASCLHPDDREKYRLDFIRLLKDKELTVNQYRFRDKNGNYYWGGVRGTIETVSAELEIAYFVYTNIDEMKQAENKLQESRQLYERTVDAMQIAMWTYDITGRRIIMGDNAATVALCKKLGWPQVFENAPESTLPTVEAEDREKYLAVFREIEAGRDASCEVWYQRQSGLEPHCSRESYHVVCDEEGRPVLAYGIAHNVTAEKKVEERYRREMEYLRHNSDESLIAKGHYNLSQNLVLEYDSSVRQKIYTFRPGISYDEAYSGMLNFSYSEADRREIENKLSRENLIRRYQRGQMQTTLRYCRTVEGQDPIWVSMTAHVYMMPETGDLELFSYAYDITAHKLIENVMSRISEEAFDYIGLIYAATGQFECIKKSPSIVFTGERQKMPYRDCCEYVRKNFVNEDERAQFDASVALENILAGLEAAPRYTATYRREENGGLHCKQTDCVWLDRTAKVILITRTDVTTAFERDQEQLRRIEAARLEADRANEAKSTFLSSMSHDLRTPLNGVLGFTSFALKEQDVQKKQQYLEKIDASGKLLLDLVNDTLELSRIESGKAVPEPEAVMPDDLVPAVVTALRPSAELKGLRLTTDFEYDNTVPVWCDKLKAQKIALNLISNSIKYTPEGGTVSVSLKKLPTTPKDCCFSLIVEDTGIGMSKEFMERMYEPFSQEKRSESVKTPGTGLGLSIVRRYVDLLGGTIEVESELHKGTRWTVSLPIREVQDGQAQKHDDAAISGTLAGKRVLLCEDNYMNTEIAVMLLKDKNILVETAENGKEGLAKFAASAAGYFDAVLMDIRMPVMDGYEATRAIRALDRPDAVTVPVIAMTADAFEESIMEAREAGMNDYVTKPIDPQKLFSVLQKYMTLQA